MRKEIARHNELYAAGRPEISDAEYDKLVVKYNELSEMGDPTKSNPLWNTNLKPAYGESVLHLKDMLSIQKMKTLGHLEKFMNNIYRKFGDDSGFYYTPKLDGMAIKLIYIDGELHKIVSRGDGKEGKNLSHQFRSFIDVPKTLNTDTKVIEICGEAVIRLKDFEWLNSKIEEGNFNTLTKPYANPRNCVAGLLNSKEVEFSRSIHFVAVDVGYTDKPFSTFNHFKTWCFNNKIRTLEDTFLFTMDGEFIDGYEEHLKRLVERGQIPYELDGYVVKLNEMDRREKLGKTNHHYKYQAAYKFKSEQKESVITDINTSIGETGKITYVANISPVEIGGTVISKVNIHTKEQVEKKGYKIGTKVLVERAGLTIPQIVKVIK